MNEENLAISLQKCKFAKEEITWLGLTITPNGVTPTNQKWDAFIDLENPKTLKQLRSLMGCIHHLIKFIPNFSEISEPVPPLLSKANTKSQNRLDWKEDQHTIAINQIKEQIKKITENKPFDTTKQTRVRCDASKKGLGACLEQKCGNTWETIAFASRFLNNLESRCSTNEIELLAVVWSLEHFKYYLYGSEFILQTDYQALLTALKEDRGNKTYQSRLTRWADRLLPFHFINGFYGLTDMPVIFQRTIDKTLLDINSKFVYADDILIIAKGTLEDHKKIDRTLHRLNEENLAISLQKCKFAREEITWLGLTITPNGVTPTNQKCEAIINLENPKKLKQLRSFMGCIHYLIKFIPNLAEFSELLRPLLSKANTKSQNRLDWKDQHTIAINQIKEQIKKITENKPFDTTKQTRVRCDASKKSRSLFRTKTRKHMGNNSIRQPLPK